MSRNQAWKCHVCPAAAATGTGRSQHGIQVDPQLDTAQGARELDLAGRHVAADAAPEAENALATSRVRDHAGAARSEEEAEGARRQVRSGHDHFVDLGEGGSRQGENANIAG